jgi:Ca2+-transporting ATPase
MIEMFNAVNALSDESSLLTVGFFANPLLLIAISLSVALHCMICYIGFFEQIFGTVSLSTNDWILVVAFAGPVILLEEILKIVAREKTKKELALRMAAIHHAEKKE